MEMYPLVVSAVNVSQVMRTELNTIVFHICDCAASHLAAPMYRGGVPAGKSIPAQLESREFGQQLLLTLQAEFRTWSRLFPQVGDGFAAGWVEGQAGWLE